MARKTNIEINGKQYYRVRRTVGHKADGSPIIKPFYGIGINEANAKADEYINNLKLGIVNNDKNVTVNHLFPKWLFEVKKNEVKPTTFEKYEGIYRNYIENAAFSNILISDIKSLPIQKYYNELSKSKNDTLIKSINKLLRNFFAYAEKEG